MIRNTERTQSTLGPKSPSNPKSPPPPHPHIVALATTPHLIPDASTASNPLKPPHALPNHSPPPASCPLHAGAAPAQFANILTFDSRSNSHLFVKIRKIAVFAVSTHVRG
ncbi:hypothetical protein Zmor_017101 [Zophobas morio]|uniref:Uncharacterized protein n=1 Tax=Zophobas morio TaxID=2755281 RepID=A0AA38MC44_9CUCU|nr:hypothetical protein Zmor_017101 [Zophobas morio]